jgi:hypothetical protein
MADVDNEPGELDTLLADIQRTIRENKLFISKLKSEAAVPDEALEESDSEVVADDGDYEEL